MASPVLLLHGFATSAARTWGENGWLDLLADAGREVLALDLLGHGTAPKPHDPSAYAQIGARVLECLPDEPVDGIAFSLGARVLLDLASEVPQRFGRLVVAGVGANLLRDDDPEPIAAAIEGHGDPSDPIAGYFARLASTPDSDPAALAALLRCREHPHLTGEALARVINPVLVVLGDADFAGPPEPLLELLPDARLVTLRGVDHFSTPKDFGFIDAALEFIGALPDSAR